MLFLLPDISAAAEEQKTSLTLHVGPKDLGKVNVLQFEKSSEYTQKSI